MLLFWLKIATGLFAFIIAILGVSDLKSLVTEPSGTIWVKRLTKWGVVKIVCALATLTLLGTNEWVTYQRNTAQREAAAAEEQRLKAEAKEDREKLENARLAAEEAIVRLSQLENTNGHLLSSLYKSRGSYGIIRVENADIKSIQRELSLTSGEKFRPKNGDLLEWRFVCDLGSFPNFAVESSPSAPADFCRYGRLMANGFPINLDDKAGKALFIGTAGNGGVMSYRSAAELARCEHVAIELKERVCELQIEVQREARWTFVDAGGSPPEEWPANSTISLCRVYEALYGRRCEDVLAQVGRATAN